MTDPIIRPMRPEDAADHHEVRTRPGVIWGTLQVPTLSMEDIRQQTAYNPNNHKLVAEVDGRMVATVGLHVNPGLQGHVGYLGMSVHDDYQGRGLGKRLMAAILDVADNWLLLDRVCLGVYPDNARAIHLYESFGFVREGLSPAVALRDGHLVDMLHMGRVRGRRPSESPSPEPVARSSAPRIQPVIRALRSDDLRAVHALYTNPALLTATGRLPTLQLDEVRKELCAVPRNNHIFVAEYEREIIGMVHLQQYTVRRSHSGVIRTLVVDPVWQGRGAGEALLRAALDLAERWLGLKRLEIAVPCTAGPAQALCAKLGFTQEAVWKAELVEKGRLIDAFLMGRVRL